MRSLGGQAYLILSGAIKQPAIRLANCNMMNYERGDDIYYLFYNLAFFFFFIFTGGDAVTLRTERLAYLAQYVKIKMEVIQTSVRFWGTHDMAKSLFLKFITVSEHQTPAEALFLMDRRKNNFEQGEP